MTKVKRVKQQDDDTSVAQISPDHIDPNPENPRLIFNQSDLDLLLDSIKEVGIQVPLTVYRSANNSERYVILDGERRWRCSKKLNLKTIPVFIRSTPSALENLLIMFNIHNVRENWALLPTAYKLQKIKDLVAQESPDRKPPSNGELSVITGIRTVQINRAFELLNLPQEDLERLENELKKPRNEQKVTEDFYIEAIKAAKTIERHKPEISEKYDRNEIIHNLLDKYDRKVITNIVDIRNVSKLARADKTSDADPDSVNKSLLNLLDNQDTTISQAFNQSAAESYQKRTIIRKLTDINSELKLMHSSRDIDNDIKDILVTMHKTLSQIIGRHD